MATTPSLHGATAGGEKKPKSQDDGSAKNGMSAASGKQRGRKGGSKNQGPKKQPQRGMGVAQLEQLLGREQWKRASGDEGAADASSSVLLPLLPDRHLQDHRLQTLPPSFHDPLAGTPIHYPTRQQQVSAYAHAASANPHGFTNQFRWNSHQPARYGDGSGSFQPIFGASSAVGGAGTVMPDQAAVVPYNPSCNCTGFFKKKRTETYELPEKAPITGYFHCNGPTYTPPNQFGTTFDDQVAVYRNILESSVLFGRKMCTEYEFFPHKLNQDHHIITDPNQGDYHHHGPVGEAKSNVIDLSLRL